MKLPAKFNSYIFQLVHSAQRGGKDLTIDEMIAALMNQDKRKIYNKNKLKIARTVKSNNKSNNSAF